VEDEALDVLRALDHQALTTETVWEWFLAALPRCARLVPSRRRETFVRGFLDGLARQDFWAFSIR
jgi:hypothetical protein